MTTDDKGLVERLRAPAGEFTSILDRAEAADRIEQLSSALRDAAAAFRTIQELNSHGACDKTYIDWLRANAKHAERKTLSALQSLQVGGE